MENLTINNKKFVVIEKEKFDKIQQLAARKSTPVKRLTLAAGKIYSSKLIDDLSKEK